METVHTHPEERKTELKLNGIFILQTEYNNWEGLEKLKKNDYKIEKSSYQIDIKPSFI